MTDPLDFVQDALAELPAAPAEAFTPDAVRLLLAVHEGLTRISERLRCDGAELWDSAAMVETVAELREVAAAAQRHRHADERCRLAESLLQSFIADALSTGTNKRPSGAEGDDTP